MPFGLSALAVKVLAGLALVAALLLGVGLWDAHQQALGAATVRADVATAAAAQAASAATETERRLAATQETVHVAQSQLAAASAAASAADRQRAALLVQLDRLRAGAVRGDPAAAGRGQDIQGDDPIGVLADVLGRSDARASVVDKLADERRIRAEACERSYDALTNSAGGRAQGWGDF